jgi:hypothetical protein
MLSVPASRAKAGRIESLIVMVFLPFGFRVASVDAGLGPE